MIGWKNFMTLESLSPILVSNINKKYDKMQTVYSFYSILFNRTESVN